MKRALYFLLIALLILHCDCQEEYCDEQDASKQKDCEKYKLEDGDYKCCFVEFKIGPDEGKFCEAYSKEKYDKIEEDVKKAKDGIEEDGVKVKYDKISIDCGAQYIIISLLSLILLFL